MKIFKLVAELQCPELYKVRTLFIQVDFSCCFTWILADNNKILSKQELPI